jgi:hypothetical protein
MAPVLAIDGYRLPLRVNTEGKLREEVNAAKIVVAFAASTYQKTALAPNAQLVPGELLWESRFYR